MTKTILVFLLSTLAVSGCAGNDRADVRREQLQTLVIRAKLGAFVEDVVLRVEGKEVSISRPSAGGGPYGIPLTVPPGAESLSIAWTEEKTGERYERRVRIRPLNGPAEEVYVELLIDEERKASAIRMGNTGAGQTFEERLEAHRGAGAR